MMKRFFLAIAFLLFSQLAFATVLTSTTCNLSELQRLADSATAGDTIVTPSNQVEWATQLSLSKTVTLQGACKVTVNGLAVAMGNTSSRITGGFTFVQTNTTPGAQLILAEGQNFRVDHIKCQSVTFATCVFAYGARVGQHPKGLIDHVEMTNARILVFGDGLDNRSAASTIGVADPPGVITVEDNSITFTVFGNCIDSELGARYRFRHNTTKGCNLEAHSRGPQQGTRNAYDWEISDNVMDMTGTWFGMFIRGGTGVVFNNTFLNGDTFQPWIAIDNVDLACSWPCLDQIGRGSDLPGGGQASEPAYFWNNKHGVTPIDPLRVNGADTAGILQPDRDYFLTAKPGYTAPPYPHPLQASSPDPTPAPPTPPPPPVPTPSCPLNITRITWPQQDKSTRPAWNPNGRKLSSAQFLWGPQRFVAVDLLTGCTVTIYK